MFGVSCSECCMSWRVNIYIYIYIFIYIYRVNKFRVVSCQHSACQRVHAMSRPPYESRMQAKFRMHILPARLSILSTRMQQKNNVVFGTSARRLITASHQHPRQSLSCTWPCISKGSNPHPAPIPAAHQCAIPAACHFLYLCIFFIFTEFFKMLAQCNAHIVIKTIVRTMPSSRGYSNVICLILQPSHPTRILDLKAPKSRILSTSYLRAPPRKKKTARQKSAAGGSRGCRMQPKNAPASYEFRMQILLHPSDFWDQDAHPSPHSKACHKRCSVKMH